MGNDEIKTASEDLDPTMSLEDAKSINSDDALLMSMGKKPELKRVYNFWTRKFNFSRTKIVRQTDLLTDDLSMCLPDNDKLQLVMLGRSVFNHL